MEKKFRFSNTHTDFQARDAKVVFGWRYSPRIIFKAAKGTKLIDMDNNEYYDLTSGMMCMVLGHSHPEVTEVIREMAGTFLHQSSWYSNPWAVEFAERLGETTTGDLKVVNFAVTGSEANEIAMRMALATTGKYDIVSMIRGLHGGSLAVEALTSVGGNRRKNLGPLMFPAKANALLPPYCYRCPLGLEYPSCGVKCAQDLDELIQTETTGRPAAFIAEPIQGAGGFITPPKEYFEIAVGIVRKYGGLFICDEVQSGFGRTGTHFWGFETQGVVPDIVSMAKGIGNGCPLAAVVTTPKIAQALATRIHFNTFGGNPVVCAQGRAVLEVIEREKLQQNSLEIGARLKAGFMKLAEKHALIGEVRGLGLMLGVELVKDRKTKEPAKEEAARVWESCKDMGLLLGKGGLWGNTLRIKPPMCLTRADADFLLEVLDAALASA